MLLHYGYHSEYHFNIYCPRHYEAVRFRVLALEESGDNVTVAKGQQLLFSYGMAM